MGTTRRELFIGGMEPAEVFSKIENWLGENGFKVLKKTDNYLKARKRAYLGLLYFEFTLTENCGGTGVRLEGYLGDGGLWKLSLKKVLYVGILPRRKGLELLESLTRYLEGLKKGEPEGETRAYEPVECPGCGQYVPAHVNYCPHCGRRL
jgi:hypothetical protein